VYFKKGRTCGQVGMSVMRRPSTRLFGACGVVDILQIPAKMILTTVIF
jgi:hypothetical protein